MPPDAKRARKLKPATRVYKVASASDRRYAVARPWELTRLLQVRLGPDVASKIAHLAATLSPSACLVVGERELRLDHLVDRLADPDLGLGRMLLPEMRFCFFVAGRLEAPFPVGFLCDRPGSFFFGRLLYREIGLTAPFGISYARTHRSVAQCNGCASKKIFAMCSFCEIKVCESCWQRLAPQRCVCKVPYAGKGFYSSEGCNVNKAKNPHLTSHGRSNMLTFWRHGL
jgi:hypothetical protein